MGRPKKQNGPVEIIHSRTLEFGERPVTRDDIQEAADEDLESYREHLRDLAAESDALTSDER